MPESVTRVQPKYLVIGEILRPHGVRGELRTRVLTDYPETFHDLERVYIGKTADDRHPRQHQLKHVRFNKDYALLSLDGIRDRNDADPLRKGIVMMDVADAAPLEQGEYYLYQLIGLKVRSDEQVIGVIREVLQTGANDVYVVASDTYGELLLPAHDETIVDIDFEAELVTMRLPKGLLPEN